VFCNQSQNVHAYHDGELSPEQRVSIEAHLKTCDECAKLLADLRQLTVMLSAAPMAEIPADTLAHLREVRYINPDAAILRIAGWLTAAAAAVLLAALPFWPGSESIEANTTTSLIETVAVNPPAENASDETRSEAVADAQWMADTLSLSQIERR
jgi:anti-sigma factor RsiW